MPPIPYKKPDYMDPSVTDSWFTWAKRQIGTLVGADDPAGSVMGMVGAVEVPAAKAAGKAIKAFHGSPHDFEQFSLSKIGTGEGAQAYGHGLYFAENEGVAKGYRDQLSGRTYHPDWMKLHRRELELIDEAQNIQQTINQESVKRGAKGPKGWGTIGAELPEVRQQWEPDLNRVNAELSKVRQEMSKVPQEIDIPGRMYEVNIHADPESFLDWDKPLSEQPEQVQKAIEPLRQMYRESEGTRGPYISDHARGEQIVRELAADRWPSGAPKFGASDKAVASERLREAGIPGIRYLDQGSRIGMFKNMKSEVTHTPSTRPDVKGDWTARFTAADGTSIDAQRFTSKADAESWVSQKRQGTSNYVVFDDTLISVARKYGIPLAVLSSPTGKKMLESLARRDALAETPAQGQNRRTP